MGRGRAGPAEFLEKVPAAGEFRRLGPGLDPGLGSRDRAKDKRLVQGRAHGPAKGQEHGLLVAKAHFGLGRMHVDVQIGRVEFQKDDGLGVFPGEQPPLVGLAHGGQEHPVQHRPAVDVEIHPVGLALGAQRLAQDAVDFGPGGIAGKFEEILGDGRRPKRGQPGGQGLAGRKAQGGASAHGQFETDVEAGQGRPAKELGGPLGLHGLGFEEFEPGRHGGDQVADLDARALGHGRRAAFGESAVFHGHERAFLEGLVARADPKP